MLPPEITPSVLIILKFDCKRDGAVALPPASYTKCLILCMEHRIVRSVRDTLTLQMITGEISWQHSYKQKSFAKAKPYAECDAADSYCRSRAFQGPLKMTGRTYYGHYGNIGHRAEDNRNKINYNTW